MSQIPEEFRHCFWDTDFDKLDLQANKNFIISRLYTHGGISGILWVHDTFTDNEVIDAARKRRDLNPIVANYLREKYSLDKEDMMYYRTQKVAIPWR